MNAQQPTGHGPAQEGRPVATAAATPGLPQSFVDPGGGLWLELEPLLQHQMAAIRPGEVLEVQSGDPGTIMALPGWSAGEGYVLIPRNEDAQTRLRSR